MKLQEYLDLNAKFKRMESIVDTWAIDYAIEKLTPLLDDGFEPDDVADLLQIRWDEFVRSGKLEEIREKNKQANE